MTDPSHKTLRSFYCRDYLWELYEVIARDLGCSTDYLINEALRHYARSCNYSIAVPLEGEAPVLMKGAVPANATPLPQHRPPPLPPRRQDAQSLVSAPIDYQTKNPQQNPPIANPASAPMRTIPAVTRPVLFFELNGQRVKIDQNLFVIGRGSDADFTIRDSNISRKHCQVIWREGSYFIQDLGSTNGIEFAGVRVPERRIFEGDVYALCDYHLRFTYVN